MNKFLVLATLLALAGFATALNCATNASPSSDSSKCNCNAGYYGTDASAGTGSCSQCPNNTSSTPGPNTAGGVNPSVCNICVAGYYVSTAAQGSNAAQCTQCNGNSTPATQLTTASSNQGACNACMIGYYYAAAPANQQSPPTCTQCPANSTTKSIQASTGFCTCFDSNANPLSSTVNTCTCKSGYQGTPVQTAGASSTCTTYSVILSIFAALLSLIFIF